MSSLREAIRDAQGAGEEFAADVLSRSGVRTDQAVPPEAGEPLPVGGPKVEGRYRIGEKLGEGGMGVVLRAHDLNLGRDVALKTMHDGSLTSARLQRFVAEARITAQLEHPSIVPVHDLFVDDTGNAWYSMKRVQGQSLADVLDGLRAGDPDFERRYNVHHLLGVFRQACLAVAYAHRRRVVHRDLKPANVMVGEFGEVLVMDWGVARVLDDPSGDVSAEGFGGPEPETAPGATGVGAVVGSPSYMAPEQLRGDRLALGPWSDVWSLGVILFELLTLRLPFRGDSLGRLLWLVAHGDVPSPREVAGGREIPAGIEAICVRALQRDPSRRYADAAQLVADLEAYLDGVRPRLEADRLVARGRALLDDVNARNAILDDAETRLRSLQSELKPWDPAQIKQLVDSAEVERDDAGTAYERAFGDCEAAFESALSHVAAYRPACEGLADLYWIRFQWSEAQRDFQASRRWAELIRRYGHERYARRLRGDGTLTVRADPARAKVVLRALRTEHGRSEPGTARSLGKSPVQRETLPMGAYSIEVSARNHIDATVPIVIGRLQDVELRLTLLPTGAVPPGFVHVPAGAVTLGGDPAALSGLPETQVELPGFAIAVHPVTVAEYFEFLEALAATSPAEAARRIPRARGPRGGAGTTLFDWPGFGAPALPMRDRTGAHWRPDHPIVSIDARDARAYAAWRARVTGFPLRLPTEFEWEKAARGADRRRFPWGDRFDASYCVMSESAQDPPDLPVIGAAPTDRSPYGVHDLGGGVRDWVAWDAGSDRGDGRQPLRGGSYGTVEVYCRCASRSVADADYVGSHVGFRLACDLPEGAR